MGQHREDPANVPLTSDAPGSPRRLGPYSTLHLQRLAPILAIISCVLFSFNGELLQFLQLHASNEGNISPMLNLIICHSGGLLFAPHFLFWKPLGFSEGLGMNVQMGSLLIAFLLMGYNYLWLQGARYLTVGLTNAIFQTSVAFVYLCGVTIFRDTAFAPAQIIGVALCLLGSALASGLGGDRTSASHQVVIGVLLALFASLGNTIYQVLFKYLFGHLKNDARFLVQIGAWCSLWHVVAIFPLVLLAHVVGFETIEIPHGTLAVIGTFASACIASTVNALYICIVMWGSSMLLPCASMFSVPFTVALDMLLHGIRPSRLEMLGHTMVVASVVLILDLHKAFRYGGLNPATASKLRNSPKQSPAEERNDQTEPEMEVAP